MAISKKNIEIGHLSSIVQSQHLSTKFELGIISSTRRNSIWAKTETTQMNRENGFFVLYNFPGPKLNS